MYKCIECKNKIGIFESYRHTVIGGKKYVCGNCFTVIDKSMEKWREFVISNSFNSENKNYKFNKIFNSYSNPNTDLKKIFKLIISPGKIL